MNTTFHPGSKTDWRKRLSAVTHYIDDLESSLIQASSTLSQQAANLNLQTPQAAAKDKAMSTDAQDKVTKVIYKLSVLDDLFAMYWVAHDKVDFQKNSLSGITFIIADCIDELKEAAK